jgi:hypothetical protein
VAVVGAPRNRGKLHHLRIGELQRSRLRQEHVDCWRTWHAWAGCHRHLRRQLRRHGGK